MTGAPRPPLAAVDDPHIERTVLGGLVALPGAWPRIRGVLQQHHFAEPAAEQLFQIINRIGERDGRVGMLAVRAALELDPGGTDKWRNNAIVALVDSAPVDLDDFDSCVGALVELWARRRVLATAEWIKQSGDRAYTSPYEVARDAAHILEDVLAAGQSARVTRSTLAEAALTCLEEMDVDAAPSLTTGLVDLDRYTGGYVPGRLIVLAGRPGMGKSTLAPSSGRQAAVAGGGVYYVSLEMSRQELSARMLTDAAWTKDRPIAYADLLARPARLESYQRDRLNTVLRTFNKLPIVIDDQSGLTVEELQGRVRRVAGDMARKGQRLALVVVDYLQLLAPSQRYAGNPVREIGEIARRLKIMAKDLDVCVLALCQLNRGVEGRDDKRPTKADLRQSGEIEENADQVLLLYREAAYLARRTERDPNEEADRVRRLMSVSHDLEIILDKNRHGPEGTVRAWADMGACAVRSASYGGWE